MRELSGRNLRISNSNLSIQNLDGGRQQRNGAPSYPMKVRFGLTTSDLYRSNFILHIWSQPNEREPFEGVAAD
jgi:hypothetical protein